MGFKHQALKDQDSLTLPFINIVDKFFEKKFGGEPLSEMPSFI